MGTDRNVTLAWNSGPTGTLPRVAIWNCNLAFAAVINADYHERTVFSFSLGTRIDLWLGMQLT